MLYSILKNSHMTLALLSITGFLLRAYFSFYKPTVLNIKIIKIAPHIIDTLLLVAAISLLVLLDYGFASWIIAKIILLVCYIGFGVIVIKRRGNLPIRIAALIMAIICFVYIAGIAFT